MNLASALNVPSLKLLTVTKVVFELAKISPYHRIISLINSNKGCFWIQDNIFSNQLVKELTVTKVVFEFKTLSVASVRLSAINSNKGCFWIRGSIDVR